MKKVIFLSVVTVIGIIMVNVVIQSSRNSCDDLLNANIEALAWNHAGGGDGRVDCMEGENGCTFPIYEYDENGKIITDPEGNPISNTGIIPYLSNIPPKAQ